jgi:hypothetical protein
MMSQFSMYFYFISVFTKVVSSNPVHGEVYSKQHYVIKFVSDLRQVGGFHRVLVFPLPIKLTGVLFWLVWFTVFNATFNNISVIPSRSVLLVEETRVLGENHRPVASH